MSYATKNYMGPGGEEWVIGGKLTVLPGATVTGLSGAEPTPITPASAVEALENTTQLSDVIATVNEIILNLKAAGLMAE